MIQKNIPNKIAIFPLSKAIFFPGTVLPLNIFEKRYIQLVSDSMKKKRLFGMVQPKNKLTKKTDIYKVGCLGKIISFNETGDKRFIIALSGIIRFKIKQEIDNNKLYREFEVDYSDYLSDLEIKKNKSIDKINLIKKVEFLFKKKNYSVKIEEFKKLNTDQLINTISMISPFSIEEKQKLIETIKIEDKLKALNDIINFNLLDNLETKTIQ